MSTERLTLAALARAVEEGQRDLREHRVECLQVRKDANARQSETNVILAGVQKEIADFKALPQKAIIWLGGIVLAAAVSNLCATYFSHQATAQAVSTVAVQAEQANQKIDGLKKAP